MTHPRITHPTHEVAVLSGAHEVWLVSEARLGCASAKQEIVLAHMRLVRTVVRRIRHGAATEDALAEGALALLEAFDRFDPSFGVRFATYATHWIRALVTRQVRVNRRIVAAPETRAARRVFGGLGRVERKLAAFDSSPSSERLAAELGVTVDDLQSAVASARGGDVPIGSPRDGSQEVEPASDDASPEEVVARAEETAAVSRALAAAIARLPQRERHIIEARYAEVPRTLDDLATELHISRERVRQLERRGLDRLGVDLRGTARVRVGTGMGSRATLGDFRYARELIQPRAPWTANAADGSQAASAAQASLQH